MKNIIVALIIFSQLSLMGCNDEEAEENKVLELQDLVADNQWKLYKTRSSNDTDFVFVNPSSVHVYYFKSNGRYLVKYPSPSDTVYVEGDWAVQSKPLVIDFLNHDKIYRYQPGEIPRLVGTPADWNVITYDTTQMEIAGIKGDSLLGYQWILRQ